MKYFAFDIQHVKCYKGQQLDKEVDGIETTCMDIVVMQNNAPPIISIHKHCVQIYIKYEELVLFDYCHFFWFKLVYNDKNINSVLCMVTENSHFSF